MKTPVKNKTPHLPIEKLNEIVDWIKSLPEKEQFKLSPLDFIRLAYMLEKYKND